MKLSVILVLLSAVAIQSYGDEKQHPTQAGMDSTVRAILEKHHVPGAGVVLLSADSMIWKGSFGLADIKRNIPVSDKTLFTIGSLSKSFLAAAAMIAQEKGLLNINDPIESLVPSLNYRNPWQDTDPVRLIHLLEHTSGFDEAHFNLFPVTDSSTPFREVIEKGFRSMETRWRPGAYFEYNTFGYVIAAYIIEERVGMPFEDFVKENILTPLEMSPATYHPIRDEAANFSHGYQGSDFDEVSFPDILQWPAGTLTTTADGVANFVHMLLNNGRFESRQILDTPSVIQMETPETSLRARAGINVGYGKGIWGKIENSHHFYGHTGRAGGFLAEFGYSRKLDVGYVILINSVDGSEALKAIKNELFSLAGVVDKETDIQTLSVSAGQQNDLTGCYQPITAVPQLGQISYFIMRLIDMPVIKEDNGQLYESSMLGGRTALLRTDDFKFRRPGEPVANSVFIESKEGNRLWLTDEGAYRKIPLGWGYFQFVTTVTSIIIVLLSFVTLLVWICVRLFKHNTGNLTILVLPFLAVCSLVAMILSVALAFDPMKLYSAGAILFLTFGWLFLVFSLMAIVKVTYSVYKRLHINSGVKIHAMITSASCCIIAGYLLYWGVIGLTLWDY